MTEVIFKAMLRKKPGIFVLFVAIFSSFVPFSSAIRCWQCAAVDGRTCPEDANLVNSNAHDACITWRVGNGSILLQNLVRFSEECTPSKVNFWSKFIDLYYRGTGGNIQCCTTNGCNSGGNPGDMVVDRFTENMNTGNTQAEVISGLPAELPGASLSSFLQQTGAFPVQSPLVQQQAFQQPSFQVSIFFS